MSSVLREHSVNSWSIRRKLSVPKIKAAADLAAETSLWFPTADNETGGAEEMFMEKRSI